MRALNYDVRKVFRATRIILIGAVFMIAMWMTLGAKKSFAFESTLPPFQETPAYKQLQKQPPSELAKINYLFNRFSQADLKVVYNQSEYEMKEAIRIARSYLYKHYHKETAEYWIKNYCYKSEQGQTIHFKDKNGKLKPLRDVALEELSVIEKKGR